MWRKIKHSRQGWEYRAQGRTLATMWRLKDLNIWGAGYPSERGFGIFINGIRKGPAFDRRWQAMQFAQEHMMGWICSQFRIAGYVFAEVKQRRKSRRWYFVTIEGQSATDYDQIADAFKAAEEAVLENILEWTKVQNLTMGYVSAKPRRRS